MQLSKVLNLFSLQRSLDKVVRKYFVMSNITVDPLELEIFVKP